jgi:hypothetical protein
MKRRLLPLCIALISFAAQCETYTVYGTLRQIAPAEINAQSMHLQVSAEGVAAHDLMLEKEQGPRRIFILQDKSSSIDGGVSARAVYGTLIILLRALDPHDQVILGSFAKGEIHEVTPVSPSELLSRLTFPPTASESSSLGRSTALRDAVADAANVFLASPQAGDAIVVISDGVDTASKISAKQLSELLISSSIRVFLLDLPGEPASYHGESSYLDLKQLVADTGGATIAVVNTGNAFYYSPENPGYDLDKKTVLDMASHIVEAAAMIHSRFKLQFTVDKPLTGMVRLRTKFNHPKHSKAAVDLFMPKYLVLGNAQSP